MKCPSCGANANGAYCEYCGTKMPVERVETQSIHAEHVVVNNYYYPEPQQPAESAWAKSAGQRFNPSAEYVPGASSKSRIIALLLCFFLGYFGAHRFYVGNYLMGVVYLFTFGVLGIGWLVDLVLILLGKMRDRYGLAVLNW